MQFDQMTFEEQDLSNYAEHRNTEGPKSYRKYVLHLLKYKFAVYLIRCITDLR